MDVKVTNDEDSERNEENVIETGGKGILATQWLKTGSLCPAVEM